MPRKLVTPQDIKKMNELYISLHTYAAVAREVGFSATTVKKYIITDYVPKAIVEANIIRFSGGIKDIKEIPLPQTPEEWQEFMQLTDEEKQECDELRKEILL